MDRISRLVVAAGTLRRRIWASLPWGVRIAEFMTRMALTQTDAYGQAFYEVFLKNDVADVPNPRGSEAKRFGMRAYKALMSKFHNPQLVEDVLSSFMMRFIESGAKHLRDGASLADAENYVLRGLTNEGLNHLRKKREVSDTYVSEGEEKRHELPIFDEDTVERQLRRLLPRMRSKLEAIHPDAPLYVKLSLIDGHTDQEIIGDVARGIPSMLEHPYGRQGGPLEPRQWSVTYRPQIYAVLKRNFQDLQSAV